MKTNDTLTLASIRERAKGTPSERDVEILCKALHMVIMCMGCRACLANSGCKEYGHCEKNILTWAAAEVAKGTGE